MIPATTVAPIEKKAEPKRRATRLKSKALREIRDEQNSTKMVIPHAPFQRLVQETAAEFGPSFRFRKDAIQALQTDCEDYIIGMFNTSNLLALRAGRETIHAEDIQLWKTITRK
jgi:histone H3/H4